jgi:hypothetical protein
MAAMRFKTTPDNLSQIEQWNNIHWLVYVRGIEKTELKLRAIRVTFYYRETISIT